MYERYGEAIDATVVVRQDSTSGDREFQRKPGNTAISAQGFEVCVDAGSEVTIFYREPGKQASIPAERTRTGAIGLFMDWAEFPADASPDDKRRIFERVIRALYFLEIPIGEVEIDPASNRWPLPPRPSK